MKLNNKGFAISTILYGLLVVIILLTTLLMSTMAFTRKNSKEFTDGVRDDLEENHSLSSSTIKNNNVTYEFLASNSPDIGINLTRGKEITVSGDINIKSDCGNLQRNVTAQTGQLVFVGDNSMYSSHITLQLTPERNHIYYTATIPANTTATGKINVHIPDNFIYNGCTSTQVSGSTVNTDQFLS